MRTKLTEARVRALRTDRRRVVWDEMVAGLGIRISPAGRRAWILQYRLPGGGAERKLTVGTWPTITVAAARELARGFRAQIAAGEDPALERRKVAQLPSLGEVFGDFMAGLEGKRRPNTLKEYRGCFRRYVLPVLGSGSCAAITHQDIATLHHRVGVRHGRVAANRMLKTLRRVLDHAQRLGAIPAERRNACWGVELFPERTDRGRALTPVELRAVWEALGEGRQADAVRVVLLSGLRPSEIRLLRWEEVGEGGRVLLLKESKTGPRVAHAGRRCGEIILGQPRLSAYVFAGNITGQPFHDLRRAWETARDAAGVTARLYDLRHSFASVAGERVELSEDRVGRLLGHSVASGSMTRRYSHRSTPAVLRDAERVEAAIWQIITGQERGGAEVVTLRRSATL